MVGLVLWMRTTGPCCAVVVTLAGFLFVEQWSMTKHFSEFFLNNNSEYYITYAVLPDNITPAK